MNTIMLKSTQAVNKYILEDVNDNVKFAAKPATEHEIVGARAKAKETKKDVRTTQKDLGMEATEEKEKAASTPWAATRSRPSRSQ